MTVQRGELLRRKRRVDAAAGLQRKHVPRRPVLEPRPRCLRVGRAASHGVGIARRDDGDARVAALHRVTETQLGDRLGYSSALISAQRAAEQPQARLVGVLDRRRRRRRLRLRRPV